MTPMESLLTAIDNVGPILLPLPNHQRKRTRLTSPPMSIESLLDDRPIKKQCSSPPLSPKEDIELNNNMNKINNKLVCYYSSVAQKSYGTEKRFLCPPPIIKMNQSKTTTVAMSVVCETMSNPSLEQHTTLDENHQGLFKYLFVNGTAKAKQFNLRINLDNQLNFYTNPISIISKPSKKTSKARNISTCLFNHSLVSLFNRINSQTVRTKYLSIENQQLATKHASWSPFEIIVLKQPNQTIENHTVSSPITYGTEIILKDINTGLSSPPLIIKKVDKGQIIHHAYGILSQMQKVALQLVQPSSSTILQNLYLNANGSPIHQQDDLSINNHNTNTWIDFISSKQTSNNNELQEIIDDNLCWTIIGISKSEYEFQSHEFNNSFYEKQQHQLSPPPSPSSQSTRSTYTLPRSIIPYPSIEYLSHLHALKLDTSHPAFMIGQDIWLGHTIGPLTLKNHQNHLLISLPDIQDILLTNHDLFLSKPDGTRYFELPLLSIRKQDRWVTQLGKSLFYHILPQNESGQWSIIDTAVYK